MRELVYYVAVSLDGYIAGPNGEFDAFPVDADPTAALNERFGDAIPTYFAEALGIRQTCEVFDTVLMGGNTFAIGLAEGVTSPYRHLRQFVFSRRNFAEGENLTVTSADPVQVVKELKAEEGSAIWLCGGGNLATALIGEIDRLVLKRNPLLFGDGIPLFEPAVYDPAAFTEVGTDVTSSGVVVSEYRRRR